MNNKALIIAISAVIVIGGIIGGIGIYNEKKANTQVTSSDNANVDDTTNTTPEAPKDSKSFKELLSGGGSVECTFTNNDQTAMKMNGTVFSNGKMMRGDYQADVAGKLQSGHLVIRDGFMYSWIDGMAGGMKMKLDTSATTDNTDKQGLDYDKKMGVTCTPWIENAGQFTLPTDRQFQDISAMMKINTDIGGTSASGSAGASAQQCAVCDNLTGTQKTQCRNALNCK